MFSDIETRTVNDTWEVAIDLLVEESINSIIFVPFIKYIINYQVQSGDSLGVIAQKNNTTVSKLMELNPNIYLV